MVSPGEMKKVGLDTVCLWNDDVFRVLAKWKVYNNESVWRKRYDR